MASATHAELDAFIVERRSLLRWGHWPHGTSRHCHILPDVAKCCNALATSAAETCVLNWAGMDAQKPLTSGAKYCEVT